VSFVRPTFVQPTFVHPRCLSDLYIKCVICLTRNLSNPIPKMCHLSDLPFVRSAISFFLSFCLSVFLYVCISSKTKIISNFLTVRPMLKLKRRRLRPIGKLKNSQRSVQPDFKTHSCLKKLKLEKQNSLKLFTSHRDKRILPRCTKGVNIFNHQDFNKW
jgi:hypothetical protein